MHNEFYWIRNYSSDGVSLRHGADKVTLIWQCKNGSSSSIHSDIANLIAICYWKCLDSFEIGRTG